MKNIKYVKIAVFVAFIMVAGVLYSLRQQREGDVASFRDDSFTQEEEGKEGLSKEPEDENLPTTQEKENDGSIFVHICGEVVSPGMYELPDHARINDAVEMAGGFTKNAALDGVNLASPLSDGQQVYILSKKEAKERNDADVDTVGLGEKTENGNSANDVGEIQVDNGLVNLNTANKDTLMTLSGIGEAKAKSIIQYREEHGGFQAIEDIMKINGIKEGVFNKIKDRITV